MHSMPGRSTNWPRPMLERLLELNDQGLKESEITTRLQGEFDGLPEWIGETKAELRFLKSGAYNLVFASLALFW